jgi:hypothetical protein
MAMSKGTNGFNALKLMLETFDGRATQTVDAKINQTPKIIFQHADGKVIGE